MDSSSSEPLCQVLLLDGGLGTTLEAPPYNFQFSSATPLWSSHLLLSSPETLLSVHRAFADAGADVLLTATYQASVQGFRETNEQREKLSNEQKGDRQNNFLVYERSDGECQKEAVLCMTNAIQIARRAFTSSANNRTARLVALSLGAYGACMTPSQEYTGAYEPLFYRDVRSLESWHGTRLDLFRASEEKYADVNLIAFETLPLLNEILAVRNVMGLANIGPNKKRWWVSCVFPNDNMNLPDGSSVEQVVEAMLGVGEAQDAQQPWGIGINCTKLDKLEALIEEFERAFKALIEKGKVRKASWDEEDDSENLEEEWPWLVIYPDGAKDLTYDASTKAWEWVEKIDKENDSPKEWDEEVYEIVQRTRKRSLELWGGVLVGGCCKTTPESIARLRIRLHEDK